MPSADWSAPTATGPVDARVVLPGSKSLTNRYLVLAALASDVSRLRAPLRSRDTLLMAQALRTLGAVVDDVDDVDWLVTPARLVGGGTVDCGLAGNVMRFVPPVAGLADGAGALRRRPARPVAPDGPGARRAAHPRRAGRRRRPRRPAVHRARPRVGARRGGHPRRLGLVAVRLGPAAVGGPLRRGRHGAPRRQGGAEPAAHRDDGRDAARRGRRRRRRRRAHLAGRAERGQRPRRAGRARPVQRGPVPRRCAGHRRPGARAGLAAVHHPGWRLRARRARHDGRRGRARPGRAHRQRRRRHLRRRRRPARLQRADPGRRGPVRPGRLPQRHPRGRAHPRARDRPARRPAHRAQRARRRRSTRPTTGCASRRGRCTAAPSTPTPTTAWSWPPRCSGWRVPGLVVEDVDTVAKTMPEFTQLWATCSPTGSRRAPDGAGVGLLRRVRCADPAQPQGNSPAEQGPTRPRGCRARPGDRGRPGPLHDARRRRRRPARRASRCGPASWAARASSSATTSASSATPPGSTAAWPASCGWRRAAPCCAAPPTTPTRSSGCSWPTPTSSSSSRPWPTPSRAPG